MIYKDFTCRTRADYAADNVQNAIDKFLAAPKCRVSDLEWTLGFVLYPEERRRVISAVLAFSGLRYDGYPASQAQA